MNRFQIDVLGGDHEDLSKRYPIQLKIRQRKKPTKKGLLYEVWIRLGKEDFSYGIIALRCRRFVDFPTAKQYLIKAMKLAMTNQFVYRRCLFCGEKIFFPSIGCDKCFHFDLNEVSFCWEKNEKILKLMREPLKYGRY